jgi:hypothetical protein
MVEISGAVLCTLLVTLMRKLVGRIVKPTARDTQPNGVVVKPTSIQMVLLGTTASVCLLEAFIASTGGADVAMAMHVIKTLSWLLVLSNALYHFVRGMMDLRDSFAGFAAKSASMRVKVKLKANMRAIFATACLLGGLYASWPMGGKDFGCSIRLHGAAMMARSAVGTVGAVGCHVSLLVSIWTFKRKTTQTRPSRKHQYWYVESDKGYVDRCC